MAEGATSEVLAVVGNAPVEVARTLDLGGYQWKALTDLHATAEARPDGGWAGVLAVVGSDSASAWNAVKSLRADGDAATPVLVLLGGAQLADLELRDELYDDFCLLPAHPAELEARLRHLLRGTAPTSTDVIQYRELSLNVSTYQASIAGRSLDLTYMEYELLKFLAQNPGKVFTREMLLNRVWGYEYYGGARTVDVHVRRLRAKLGEEHASMIDTVRSVGYRFGQPRWGT